MRVACACVSVVLSVSVQSAKARIRLSDCEIRARLLVVAGRTQHANESITLDGNAVCAAGPAALETERQISCGSANAAPMIASCAH